MSEFLIQPVLIFMIAIIKTKESSIRIKVKRMTTVQRSILNSIGQTI